MSWTQKLSKAILDPKNILLSSENAVVIADKYPKAKQHYLVLPKVNISSIYELTKEDLSLLEELQALGNKIIELRGGSLDNFKCGFHMEPSMQHLHMHVVSKDFVSDCLKTKKHWNSFNTELFIPFHVLYAQLAKQGRLKRLDREIVTHLTSTALCCNQCDYVATNIPSLKGHLLGH